MFKKEVEKILKKYTNLKEIPIEIPRSSEFGDYAFPCFILSKKLRKNPADIADDLVSKIKLNSFFDAVEANGPYVNFFVNRSKLSGFVIPKVLKEKEKYGDKKVGKKIVIESPAPNTNKPLHLGHLRNMALGLSLSKIFTKTGNKVVNVDLINDRGIHISKSMLAYQKFGRGKSPNKKLDHFVGDFYVMYNNKVKKNKGLEKDAQELLVKWEEGNAQVRALWKKMNGWAVDGIYQTYKEFGLKINKLYRESEHYEKGKNIILGGVKKGVFKKAKDGSVFVNLGKKLGKKVLLRSDGTSVYITQDLYLAKKRYSDFKMDKMIYIVASEQIYHFDVLFKVLNMLGYGFAKNLYHLAYGMVYLPEGKMKSREGFIVDADDLMKEVRDLAAKEIKKRFPKLSKKEVDFRAKIIGLGSLKFFLLKYDPLKDFVFNPKETISFEGETGPYVQYAYARISAILRKVKKNPSADYGSLGTPFEIDVIRLLGDYPGIVEQAAEQYKPSLIAHYLLKLAKAFNLFYQNCPVLKADKEIKNARLKLILAVKYVLKDGLGLLDVDVLERM